MFTLSSSKQNDAPKRIKTIAAGNAGINILDRLFLSQGGGLDAVAINTDAQSLAASVAPEKVLCGERTTHGMGAGGDPALGLASIEESLLKIDSSIEEADACILLAGLGGGTGGNILSHLARRAKEGCEKARPVLGIVTMPFAFEGPRRNEQARSDLAALREVAQAVVVFPNDAMAEIAEASGPIADAFDEADLQIAGVVNSFLEILRGRGPIETSMEEMLSAVGDRPLTTIFAHASARGANRANEVVQRALKSPLARAGLPIECARRAVVHLAAGADLSLVEVRTVLDHLRREFDDEIHLKLGITTNSYSPQDLSLTVFGSEVPFQEMRTRESKVESSAGSLSESRDAAILSPEEKTQAEQNPLEPIAPAPAQPVSPASGSEQHGILPGLEGVASSKPRSPLPVAKKPAPKATQEVLPLLDAAGKGRFDRSEPTIEEGEDLDIPTFVRQKIRLK